MNYNNFHMYYCIVCHSQYLLNYVVLKESIAAILIYITIYALLVRKGLKIF